MHQLTVIVCTLLGPQVSRRHLRHHLFGYILLILHLGKEVGMLKC